MIACVGFVSMALLWLLYEADWMRLRLLVGPNVTSCPWAAPDGIRLTRKDFGYYDHTDHCRQVKPMFSPGVTEPLCGWSWVESRRHPLSENTITIIAWGVRSTATFANDDPKRMKDYCNAALKPTKEDRKVITQQRRQSRKLSLAY